jgi:predicted Zn-dependent protease
VADHLSREEARELCESILSRSTADAAQVRVVSGLRGFTRYARNEITTSGDSVDTEVTLKLVIGQRSASVTWNHLADADMDAAVARGEQLTRLVPEDPETMPLPGEQQYVENAAFSAATSDLSDEDRVDAVLACTSRASDAGLYAAGFLQRSATSQAVANSAGLFGYYRSTHASHTVTVRTRDGAGSGWAGTTHNDWQSLMAPSELAERAISKARASVDTQPVDPGQYVVVLEPTAVGNLLQWFASALDARAADEGRSVFSKDGGGSRIGERIADERITLLSDPADPDLLDRPFTDDGTALRRTVWIEDGVLRNLAYSRYWAAEKGLDHRPFGGGLKLSGGSGDVDSLVSTVERGLLVTRFWYIRPVDVRNLLLTGLTRDGTFLIENGRIVRPVGSLRFNESLVTMLNKVAAIGSTERVVASESGGIGMPVAVPPLVLRDFHFTSASDAV